MAILIHDFREPVEGKIPSAAQDAEVSVDGTMSATIYGEARVIEFEKAEKLRNYHLGLCLNRY